MVTMYRVGQDSNQWASSWLRPEADASTNSVSSSHGYGLVNQPVLKLFLINILESKLLRC